MLRFPAITSLNQFKFGYRHIFTCQTSLVHKKLTLNNYRIARNLAIGLIEISRHQINVFDIIEYPISEHFYQKFLLSSLLDFIVTSPQQKVVYSCCQPTEEHHQHPEKHQTLQYVDN